MNPRRPAAAFVALIPLLASEAAATTAASLSDRIAVDGRLADWAADEWVLDASSTFAERAGDSRWGSDNDIARVAVTWDRGRFYFGVEATVSQSAILVMIANGPGGIASLDAAGEFRRAIDLPFAANLLFLAAPGGEPRVARADAAAAFSFVDRATIPAAMTSGIDGRAGFEASIPWTMIDASRPVRIVVAVTGAIGAGAGDGAPDPRTGLSSDRTARAVLDRSLSVLADADGDGATDAGVSPRAAAVVEPVAGATLPSGGVEIEVTVEPRAFAPDRGESVALTVRPSAGAFEDVAGRCVIHAMDGRGVRVLDIPATAAANEVTVAWDGRDNAGRVCDGGVYVAAFDVEFSAAGSRQRATRRVGVAVAR